MFKQMMEDRENAEQKHYETTRKHLDYASTIDTQARKIREQKEEIATLKALVDELRAKLINISISE